MKIKAILKNIRRKKAIGQGVYRRVYDLGNGYVLKVAKSKSGRRCNKKEVEMYTSSPYPIKKYLGRIIGYKKDYRLLIMKKYDRKLPKSKTYKRKCYKIRTKFRKNGIIPYDMITRHGNPNRRNLRLKRNGRIVVIDYGNFKYRRK